MVALANLIVALLYVGLLTLVCWLAGIDLHSDAYAVGVVVTCLCSPSVSEKDL